MISSILIFAIVAGGGYWLYMNFDRIMEGFSGDSSQAESEGELQSKHPLHKIFLGFRHGSVDEWISFIESQDIHEKLKAYQNLVSYLSVPPEELGSVTGDIITAMVAFNYPETFEHIEEFLINSKEKFKVLKVLRMYYEVAAKTLVEIDPEKAEKSLTKEIEALRIKKDNADLQIYLLLALELVDYNQELENFYFGLIREPAYDYDVKEVVMDIIDNLSAGERSFFYKRILEYFVYRENSVLSDDEEKIAKRIFASSTELLPEAGADLWSLAVMATQKPHTMKLFTELVKKAITKKSINFEPEHLMIIAEDKKMKDLFREELCRRFALLKDELELMRKNVNLEDLDMGDSIVNFERYSKTKSVSKEYLELYRSMEDAYLSAAAANRKAEIIIISGSDEMAKRHLVISAAANNNFQFAYVDTPKILKSLSEIAKLKTNIVNRKPCIIYFAGFASLISDDLEEAEKNQLSALVQIINDINGAPGIHFFADFSMSINQKADGDAYQKIKPKLDQLFNEKYSFAYDIDLPDKDRRFSILTSYFNQVNPERLESEEKAFKIVETAEDISTIELVDQLKDYFEISLLTSGKIY